MMTKPERTESEQSFINQLERANSRVRFLETKVADLHEQNAHFLKEIRGLHLEYASELCEECNGNGVVSEMFTGLGGYHDLTPPEHAEEVECSRCLGSRREWEFA